ncbi:hypothetical protein V6N13_149653 [Hibiscus sabdariffa]|uniref:Uncharacterized protein n=2 Tax=Hibiscus sabdariffa TaxID=183260 RepID=A0ABR1ZRF3_9ROSI
MDSNQDGVRGRYRVDVDVPRMNGSASPTSMTFLFSTPAIGEAMISSRKRRLSSFIGIWGTDKSSAGIIGWSDINLCRTIRTAECPRAGFRQLHDGLLTEDISVGRFSRHRLLFRCVPLPPLCNHYICQLQMCGQTFNTCE